MSGSGNNGRSSIRTVEPQTGLALVLWALTVGFWLGLLVAAFFTWPIMLASLGPIHFNWGGIWLLLLAGSLVSSTKEIEPNERAAAYFYGSFLYGLSPGLHVLPLGGLVNIISFPHDLQTILEPGPRDKIFWGDEKDEMPEGMVRPIFMNTRPPRTDETDALDVQMTVGLGYTVLWTIDDPATFNANVHSIEEANEQIRTMSEKALSEVIAEGTADDAITKQKRISDELRRLLSDETAGWGVSIQRAGLTTINLSHPLASAMRDRAAAQFERETRVIRASGEASEIELLGKARGLAAHAAESGPLLGRAEGMAKMVEALKIDGNVVFAGETARATIPGARATILGKGGLAQAASVATLFGVGLEANKPEKGASEE